jgi:hypothetical protein
VKTTGYHAVRDRAKELGMDTTIRTYAAGDDAARVGIFNEAAGGLAKFKAATLDEIRRRTHGPDFDPAAQFFAVVDGRPMAYCTFQANGRVAFPWCRKGCESLAEPLFERVLGEVKRRGIKRAFAAYRADWPAQRDFFLAHGFRHTHDMVNFALDLAEMPTPAASAARSITPVTCEDLPALAALVPNALRITDTAGMERYFLHNPYFSPDATFVLRGRGEGQVMAAGILVVNPVFANPQQLDASMPCFRLGAFGTEGLTTKRVNGLFSFLVPDGRDVSPRGLDLLSYASQSLGETDVATVAAQVSSGIPHLLRFYERYFRKQGSFPILERDL